MAMRIHLINPRNPESFWTFDRILPTIDKGAIFPNLALPTLAGLTPREHTISFCDENVEDIDLDVRADIIGITGYIVHQERMLTLIREFRERGCFVVVGGPYATLCPEVFEGLADVVFSGEAEETWPRFLEEYAAGTHSALYTTETLPDITDAPMPRFDLVDVDRYKTMTMQFARGCPYTCEFCDIIVMYGRVPRMKSVECALAEVKAIHETGVNTIFIVDDNFIGNRKVAKRFLRELVAWQESHNYPLEFYTEVSMNVAKDDELLQLMRDANFVNLFIGIESPSEAALSEARKTQNTRMDLVAAAHKIQDYGFGVMAGMIVGFDADGPEVFDAHYRFIQDARIPIAMTGLLNAIPKTPLYDRLLADERLLDDSTGDQFVFTNIVPLSMTRLELYKGYRDLLRRQYDFKSFRERTMAFILGSDQVPRKGQRVTSSELKLAWRILWDALFHSSPGQRRMTWGMVMETIRKRPARTKVALTLSIQHKHFHDYVDDLTDSLDELIAILEKDPTTRVLKPALSSKKAAA